MMTTLDCATGTLAPYVPTPQNPWSHRRAAHLVRRMGFGANPQQVEALVTSNQNPSQLVDAIINNAINKPLPPEPEWGDWALSDYDQATIQDQALQQSYEWTDRWMTRMLSQNNFREKLELFWHNHFVTRVEDYNCPSYMYQYHKVIMSNVLGNFKTFTHQMGITPAMLVFLNGVQNTRFEPNENYARELFELFTLGLDNGYTQNDIAETARILTGWNGFSEACAAIDFAPFLHDNGIKTVFGQTGNWDYDDLHNILFEQRADEIAHHICTKLYRYFVHPEVNQDIVDGLAATFIANDFELAPVYRQLFKSEHFFDEYNMDVQIKSPLELMLHQVKEMDFPFGDYFDTTLNYNELLFQIYFLASSLGQQLFNPPDVSGWDGNRTWVNGNTIVTRWQLIGYLALESYEKYRHLLIAFAKNISNNSTDPVYITQRIVDHFIPAGLQTPQDYERATIIFKTSYVPENYFEDGTWTLDYNEDVVGAQVALLVQHIGRIPEFQLL